MTSAEKKNLSAIKTIVAKVLAENGMVFQLYLFGSHARGNARLDSDFDILAVVEKSLDATEKFCLLRKIRQQIKYMPVAIDVIVKSSSEYKKELNWFGSLVSQIAKEATRI